MLSSLMVVGLGLSEAGADWTPLSAQTVNPEIFEVTYQTLTRTSLVYVPSGYDGKTPMPLVLSFHGRWGKGKDQADLTELHKVGERYGFLVVYPDAVSDMWNVIDDVGFVDLLVTQLSQRFKIDPRRIYASGMSNGGFFVHLLGCQRSSRFAAIASVAGEMSPALENVCSPEVPMAVMTIHGTEDPIAPYTGGLTDIGSETLSAEATATAWNRLNRCNGQWIETLRIGQVFTRSYQGCAARVEWTTVEGGGHTWPGGLQYLSPSLIGITNRDVNASEMIWQFFAANPQHGSPSPPSGLRIIR
jgi:polyhydroxybutyrate depolymerase